MTHASDLSLNITSSEKTTLMSHHKLSFSSHLLRLYFFSKHLMHLLNCIFICVIIYCVCLSHPHFFTGPPRRYIFFISEHPVPSIVGSRTLQQCIGCSEHTDTSAWGEWWFNSSLCTAYSHCSWDRTRTSWGMSFTSFAHRSMGRVVSLWVTVHIIANSQVHMSD